MLPNGQRSRQAKTVCTVIFFVRADDDLCLTARLTLRQRVGMTLHEYLTSHEITYRGFAAMMGRDVAEIWRWAHGQRVPGLRAALEIEKLTNGFVKPASFIGHVAKAA